jgi:oligopeptide/dipeptide ABC transporter ATP-binding protein
MSAPLLSVEGLEVDFERAGDRVPAVRGLSFEVAAGETVGIVGESGSGKSVSMLAVLGLLPRPPAHRRARRLEFAGRDLLGLSDHELRSIRGREMAMIFQDPLVALNPVLPVGFQIGEVLVRHLGLARAAVRARVLELLAHVGVPDPAVRIDQFPHQLSGGMRQRIMIAMALAAVPKLLIADEPTTALDVTVQAEIVRLVKDLQGETGMAMIWVTHDLALLARLADRVLVMYAGRIVEAAAATDLYRRPQHPFTAGLLNSIPRPDQRRDQRRSIPGNPPDPDRLPPGCPFAPRCAYVEPRCRDREPMLLAAGASGQTAACWVLPASAPP